MAERTHNKTAKAMVFKPEYRSRVVRDKSKYSRKVKHAKSILA